jgi:hypothetical protein
VKSLLGTHGHVTELAVHMIRLPCAPRCPPVATTLLLCCLFCADCDQRECAGGLTCHMFGMKIATKAGNGKTHADLDVCLQTPAVSLLACCGQ